MDKTALALPREEWQRYQPGTKLDQDQNLARWERAWEVALMASAVLRRRFGATRVVAFGTLARSDWFTARSDIDLAAWGIAPSEFYRAVAAVTGISPEFKVDLVAHEDCLPSLRRAIEREGTAL